MSSLVIDRGQFLSTNRQTYRRTDRQTCAYNNNDDDDDDDDDDE